MRVMETWNLLILLLETRRTDQEDWSEPFLI